MNAIVQHWKTTAAGVALLAVTAAFLLGRITLEAYMASVGALAALGFMVGGDGK